MKQLLMATDLSARSDRGLQRAAHLAKQLGARLDVITAVDSTLPRKDRERQEQEARIALDAQIRALQNTGQVVTAARVLSGEGSGPIIGYADDIDADLIVLGIHRHASRLLFRGTTAEQIIRLGKQPVLVVSEPVAQPYQRVLVGVDLSTHAHRALEIAIEIAPDAEFELVHAADVPFKGLLNEDTVKDVTESERAKVQEALQQKLTDFAAPIAKIAQRWEIVARDGLPQDVIRRAAEQFRPHLIAVGTHGRSGVANAMLGSVAEEILADAPTDVLAVKAG